MEISNKQLDDLLNAVHWNAVASTVCSCKEKFGIKSDDMPPINDINSTVLVSDNKTADKNPYNNTLEAYFKRYAEKGIVDFSLRAGCDGNGNTSFYIHASDVDSDTADFLVKDNTLYNEE